MFYEFYYGFLDNDMRFYRVFAIKPYPDLLKDFKNNFKGAIIWDVCLCDSEGYVMEHMKNE